MNKFIVIWIGDLISSIGSGMTAFAALLEPAYRATVTDLLSEEEYMKHQCEGAFKLLSQIKITSIFLGNSRKE